MDATVTNPVNLSEHVAHAAAAAAAGAQVDDVQSANAYAATLKILGYSMCVSIKAMSSVVIRRPVAANNNQPPMSTLVTAMVDSMATYFVVNKPEYIVRDEQQPWVHGTHGGRSSTNPGCGRCAHLDPRRIRRVELLRSSERSPHAGLQCRAVLCSRYARPL